MSKEFRILTVLFFIYCFQLQAQSIKKQPYTLGLSYHQGFLLNHSPLRTDVNSANLSNMWALEASIQFQTLGQKDWHRFYKYPTWGMSLFFYDISDKVIKGQNVAWGNGFAWIIHKNIRIINTRFFQANVRLGTGFGTFTKPYDKDSNPGNLWISAPINTSMHLNVETKYRINDNYHVVLAGTFTHFSNGATMMPNLGVNFPSLNVGIRYTPHPEQIIYITDSTFKPYKKNFFHFSFGAGAKVLPDLGITYYPTFAISALYGRRVGKVSKLLFGIDAFRDQSLFADTINITQNIDINRYGIYFGHEFMFGKAGLFFGMGRYFYKKTGRDEDYYIKTGLRYNFLPNLFGALILKTHWGRADTFEWTIGYTL
jgi:hypothetical protein